MVTGQGLFKNVYFIIFGDFFVQIFVLYKWILQPKNLFTNFQNLIFFADCNSKAQEFIYDVSIVIFGYQTWDLEMGWGG